MAYEPEGAEIPIYLQLREGCPATGVKWCFPILPGILLADSYEFLGPLNAKGTVKIVLFYGTGSVVLCDLFGWIA
jgi:hypothetical protein